MNANEIARSPKLQRLVQDSNRTFEVSSAAKDGKERPTHFVVEANSHNLWANWSNAMPSRHLAIHGGVLISNILVRVLAHSTLGTSCAVACATNVRLNALGTLFPLDGSLCNFISFIGLVTTGLAPTEKTD